MAVNNGSSPTRVEVYESLYVISKATEQITDHLERLRAAGILSRHMTELQRLAVCQAGAEIATSAINNLAAPELTQAGEYEQQQLRLRKRLAETVPGTKSHPGGTKARSTSKRPQISAEVRR